MSVTPGSVLRVLNISLCKQRNSSLTQRCASSGIRNLIFDVDRAGQGRAAGKISSGEEDEGLRLITDLLSSIVRSELMEERRDEERRGC